MTTQFFPMTVHSFKWRPHFLKMACPFKTLTASFKKSARCCLNPNCSVSGLSRSFLGKVSLNSASFRTVSGGKAQLTAEPVYLILLMLPSFFAQAATKQDYPFSLPRSSCVRAQLVRAHTPLLMQVESIRRSLGAAAIS